MSPDVRTFLIRSTRSVIDHYRRVLAVHRMSQPERDAIQDRIAREEDQLRLLQRDHALRQAPYYGLEAA